MAGHLKACGYGLAAACTAACSEPGCTLIAVPGVVVEIRDGADGTPLAATSHGVVQDGAYTDSLRLDGNPEPDALVRSAAYERPGVYRVTVEHEGYDEWRREQVRVRSGDCHVQTVHLQAHLQRVP